MIENVEIFVEINPNARCRGELPLLTCETTAYLLQKTVELVAGQLDIQPETSDDGWLSHPYFLTRCGECRYECTTRVQEAPYGGPSEKIEVVFTEPEYLRPGDAIRS